MEELPEQISSEEVQVISPEVNQEQISSDTVAMSEQLENQVIPPMPEEKQASLSGFFAKQLSKRMLKSKEVAKQGAKEFEKREADKIAIDVEEKAVGLDDAKLTDFDTEESHQFNFDTIQDSDDVAAEFAKMNEVNKVAIDTQRRNVVPDDELNELANDLSSDPATLKKVLGLKPGEVLAPEYILSMKQTLKQSVLKLKDLSQKIVSGEATPKDMITFHKQWEFHSQFSAQFMGVRAEYGRGFRALGLNPTDNVSELNNITDRLSNGTLDPTTMAQQILMAGDDKSINRVIQQQQKGFIGKSGDVMSELFISSILSGWQTHVVNSTSNAFKGISMVLDTKIASMFKADGTDVIGTGEAFAQLRGMWESNMEALNLAWKVMKTGEPYGGVDKLDVDYQKAISANALQIPEGKFASGVDAFGKVIRLSTDNLMGAEDAFFKVLSERGKLRQLAHRKATEQKLEGKEYDNFIAYFMENPTATAKEEATQAGLETTFQKRLGTAGQGFQKARESIWGGKLIMPFVKTPINLLYEGFTERTPLGFASKKFKDDLDAGGGKAQMAKAKMTIGTAVNSTVLGTLYGLEYGGEEGKGYGVKVHGSFPSDTKLRNSMKDAGIKENSIEIEIDGKTKYFSFDRLEPFNSVLRLYANVMQVQKLANLDDLNPDAEKELSKVAGGMTLAFAEATVNQTFMRGVKDLMDALTAGTNTQKIQRITSNYVNAIAVPQSAALRNITKLFDDQVKEADGMMQRIRRGIPGLNKDLKPILDNYGNPIVYENNLFPSFYKQGIEGKKDKVKNEVYRIAESTKTVPIFKPKKNFGGYRMTGEQYYDYTNAATNDKIDGLNLYDDIKKTIGTLEYRQANDHIKALYLNAIRDMHYNVAKYNVLFKKYPEIQQYDLDKTQYRNKFLQE